MSKTTLMVVTTEERQRSAEEIQKNGWERLPLDIQIRALVKRALGAAIHVCDAPTMTGAGAEARQNTNNGCDSRSKMPVSASTEAWRLENCTPKLDRHSQGMASAVPASHEHTL